MTGYRQFRERQPWVVLSGIASKSTFEKLRPQPAHGVCTAAEGAQPATISLKNGFHGAVAGALEERHMRFGSREFNRDVSDLSMAPVPPIVGAGPPPGMRAAVRRRDQLLSNVGDRQRGLVGLLAGEIARLCSG